ncbi:hypothetical protein PFLUV_G00277240 [Perca fluviatilis]|uniref:Uncharacterized protein n=1 Tax=Perca fluviatilis TaxID=8168 RepID=A0A6A5E1K5_PERFL|nr:hypothetical protein PFLUV_G00277240 [Perca fluviatilis]
MNWILSEDRSHRTPGRPHVVYLVLEDLAETAYHTMNISIDKYSLDVQSGSADPVSSRCVTQASSCGSERWSVKQCVCCGGLVSVDGLRARASATAPNFCKHGKCDIIEGRAHLR